MPSIDKLLVETNFGNRESGFLREYQLVIYSSSVPSVPCVLWSKVLFKLIRVILIFK